MGRQYRSAQHDRPAHTDATLCPKWLVLVAAAVGFLAAAALPTIGAGITHPANGPGVGSQLAAHPGTESGPGDGGTDGNGGNGGAGGNGGSGGRGGKGGAGGAGGHGGLPGEPGEPGEPGQPGEPGR